MSVRQFDWRDVAALRRYLSDSVYLDSALLLTRGVHFFPGVLFSILAPSVSVFTCVSNGNGSDRSPLIGQFIHTAGSPSSHLTFLAPGGALQFDLVGPLIDYMMTVSGQRGALRLLADVDENSDAFEALRKCGFVIYTRQHIWRLVGWTEKANQCHSWRMSVDEDVIAIRNLYNNLVPGLVQQIEPISVRRQRSLVCYQNGDLLGYVELKQGREGIWTQPFIHPDAQDLPDLLVGLVQKIPNRANRPVYMCVRTNQSWLEPLIEDLGAETGAHQAVLVRQLVVQQKAGRTFAIPSLETGQAEITAPIAHVEIQQGYASEKNNR
jgi:hypothetical protein